MVVVRARLGKPRTAFGTQPGAVFLAPRRERQRENQGISEGRLEIEQVPVQRVPVRTGVPAVLLITEQFLAPDLDGLGHRLQASCALPRHRRGGRGGDEHALGDGLQPRPQGPVRRLAGSRPCRCGDAQERARPGFRHVQYPGGGRAPGYRRPTAHGGRCGRRQSCGMKAWQIQVASSSGNLFYRCAGPKPNRSRLPHRPVSPRWAGPAWPAVARPPRAAPGRPRCRRRPRSPAPGWTAGTSRAGSPS